MEADIAKFRAESGQEEKTKKKTEEEMNAAAETWVQMHCAKIGDRLGTAIPKAKILERVASPSSRVQALTFL